MIYSQNTIDCNTGYYGFCYCEGEVCTSYCFKAEPARIHKFIFLVAEFSLVKAERKGSWVLQQQNTVCLIFCDKLGDLSLFLYVCISC